MYLSGTYLPVLVGAQLRVRPHLPHLEVDDDLIMKQVCWFFLTVYLAVSVRVDLFPSKASFCDLVWGPLAMKISAFLVVIDIDWARCHC